MRRACDITLNGCPGADFPITNASSEAPDPLMFAGVGWTNFDPFRTPILGNGPAVEIDCTNITWSTVSQELADLLAQINSAFCQPPVAPTNKDGSEITPKSFPPDPNPSIPPFVWEPGTWIEPNPELLEFQNDRQEASVTCPDGSVYTEAIEAGTATAMLPAAIGPSWVEYINAFLLAYLLQHIYDLRVCVTVPDLTNRTPPGRTPGPAPGPGTPGATFAAFPGWCCLEDDLDPSLNTYNITGGNPSAEWTFSLTAGSIPTGTTLIQTGPRSAVLQGAPDVAGNYSYTVTAVSGSSTITVNDSLNVFGLTNTMLPGGTIAIPYSESLQGNGGTSPYTFALLGTLPSGLTLDSDGTVHGTPTTNGDYLFDVNVTDSDGIVCRQTVSMTVSPTSFCGAVADSVQSAVWTQFPLAPCVTADNIVNGVCTAWSIRKDHGVCSSGTNALRWGTTICNPGAAYDITLTVPYVSSGSFSGTPHTFIVTLQIGASSSIVNCDIQFDTPQPAVCTVTLPEFSVSTVSVRLELSASPPTSPPAPPGVFVAVDPTANMTLTPLIHP